MNATATAPVRCIVCRRECGTAFAMRTGDYTTAGTDCYRCQEPVCGFCGDEGGDYEMGSYYTCQRPNCEEV